MLQWGRESGVLYSQVVAKAWADDDFAKTLTAQPRKVLADHGINIPEGVQVKVVAGQNELVARPDPSPGILELPLPARPSDLDQDTLKKVFEHWPECVIFC